MKKKLAIASIIVLVLVGCSASDFSPEVVIPKTIGSIVKTKNKLYLSSNKKFLKEVLKKQDITEEEYNKLKELLMAAKVVKDYSTVKKIESFEPFKKRVELEKSVNKLLSTNYSNIKLYVWKRISERGFPAMPREVLNDSILKKINIDLLDDYNKYLDLAKKYKMYSLVKKLKKAYPRIKQNYLIGLKKMFDYLMASNAYKKQSSNFILKLSKKLCENNRNKEAKTLLIYFAKYKLNKNMNFDIQPFYTLLVKYSFIKDANDIKKYAKNAKAKKLFKYASNKLEKDADFNISEICNSLKKLGFNNLVEQLRNKKKLELQRQQEKRQEKVLLAKLLMKKLIATKKAKAYSVKELSSLINKMKNQYISNYCLGINKKIRLEKKNAFGNIDTMTVPLNFYIKMQKIINKPEFDADIERAKFYAFCLKNTLKNTDSKYWIMYDEIYYDVVGYLQGMAYSGLLPTTFNVNVTNVSGKHFKINTNVGINYLAKGLILYLRGNEVDVPYKMMLIYAYLYANTKGQLIDETNFFLKCDTNYIGKRFVANIVKIIANNSSNPKIAILAYKLSKNDIDNLTEWFLKDKKVARIFEIMKQAYNSNNGCY